MGRESWSLFRKKTPEIATAAVMAAAIAGSAEAQQAHMSVDPVNAKGNVEVAGSHTETVNPKSGEQVVINPATGEKVTIKLPGTPKQVIDPKNEHVPTVIIDPVGTEKIEVDPVNPH